MIKCWCGTCKYNKRDKDVVEQSAWICTNEQSDYYGDYTVYGDICEDFESKYGEEHEERV